MFEFFKKLFWGDTCENCGNHDEITVTPAEELPTVTTEEVNTTPVIETTNEEVVNTPLAVEETKVEETIITEPEVIVEPTITTETVETTNTVENNWEITTEEVKI